MPPLLGWGRYAFIPNQNLCFCEWTSESYMLFMVTLCFFGPCSVMSVCYYCIIREIRASSRRVHVSNGTMTGRVSSSEPQNQDVTEISVQENQERKRVAERRRLALSFLLVIVVFIVSWLPYCTAMFLKAFFNYSVSREVDFVAILLGCFNSLCNPIIYGVLNTRFRKAYKEMFLSIIRRVTGKS